MTTKVKKKREPRAALLSPKGQALVEQGMLWLLFAALGALLGSATLVFDVRPFGIALAGASGVLFPAVAAGQAVFAIITRDYLSIAALGVLAICRLCASVFPLGRGRTGRALFAERASYRVLCVGATMLATGVVALFLGDFRYYYLLGLLLGVGCASLACMLLTPLFLRHSEAIPNGREVGLGTLVILCIFAMREVSFMGIYPAAVAAALIAFWLSAHRGTVYGAIGGLLCGLALGVGVAPAFLLCGAGFGLLEKSSRGGAILTGGTLGCIYLAAISGLDGMSELLPSLLTAGAIFLAGDSAGLVEGSPIQRLALWRRRAAVQAARSMELSFQTERIREVSGALSELSGMLYELGGRGRRPGLLDLRHLCDREFDRVCPHCEHRDICWGSEYSATAQALSKLAGRLHTAGSVEIEHAPDALVARCRSLPEILSGINDGARYLCEEALRGDKTSVIAMDYATLSRMLNETLEQSEQSHRINAEMSDRIAARLRRLGYTVDSVAVCGKTHRTVLLRGLRLPGRHIKFRDLRGVIEQHCHFPLGEAVTREADGAPDVIFCEKTAFHSTTVKQTRAKMKDGSYCGDSVMSFGTERGLEYAFLCDGMGSGNTAALTSALAATVLATLLRAGTRADTALRMLNGVLAARGRRQSEASTTVDLLELDCVSGKASLFKCGAAPTYLLRRGSTTRFSSRTAPIGILEVLDAERLRFEVEQGDVIVQVSDGVTGGEEDCPWLADMLVTRYDGDAEKFARSVLARATEQGRDDLSVLVTEIGAA